MLCCKAVSCSRPRSRGHDLLLVGRLPPPSLAGTPQQALGERSAAVAVGVACGATRVLWRAAAAHGQGKRALRPPRVCWVVRLPSALDSSSAVVAGPSVAGGEGGWAVGRVSVLLLRWLAILRRSMAILLVVAPVPTSRGEGREGVDAAWDASSRDWLERDERAYSASRSPYCCCEGACWGRW